MNPAVLRPLAIFFLIFSHGISFSQSKTGQRISPWVSYTNSSSIKDMLGERDCLWTAAGGVTRWHLPSGQRTKFLRENGLSSNNALALTLVNRILWVGTANGISAYNVETNDWKTYSEKDGLPDEAVTVVTLSPDKCKIWFGTWEGYVYSFDQQRNKWDIIIAEDQKLGCIISALTFDRKDGAVLIGTWGKGAYVYEVDKHTIKKWAVFQDNGVMNISCFYGDQKQLWVGTPDKGLWRVDLIKKPQSLEKIADIPARDITSIRSGSDRGRLFLTTMDSGLFAYEERLKRWRPIKIGKEIDGCPLTSVVQIGDRIFLGTEGQGVFQIDQLGKSPKQLRATGEIPGNRVSALASDPRNRRIWIGTEGNGAACLELPTEEWRVFDRTNHVLTSDVVNTVSVNDEGTAWIGTDDGLVKVVPEGFVYRRYGREDGLNNVLVYASHFDPQGRLWVGFFMGSPCVSIPEKNAWKSAEEIPGFICYEISSDNRSNSIWLATTQGLVCFHPETRTIERYWTEIEFRSLLVDEERREVWAGAWGKGLYHLNLQNNDIHRIEEIGLISVLDIKKDPWTNMIWFATDRGVLSHGPGHGTFEKWDAKSGLGLNFVLSIAISPDSIWFGTWGGGLSRLLKPQIGTGPR